MNKIVAAVLGLTVISFYPAHTESGKINIKLAKLYSSSPFEEWKNPGFYSPANVIDGDIKTCFVKDDKDMIFEIRFIFEKKIYIDEIRVMNGCAENKSPSRKNNILHKLSILFYEYADKRHSSDMKQETILLDDKKECQVIKFQKRFHAKHLLFRSIAENICQDGIYKDTETDNMAIAEIELYYKSKKIRISNIDQLKEQYIKSVERHVINAFSGKVFDILDGYCQMETYPDGYIRYEVKDPVSNTYIETYMPEQWRVDNSKLYLRYRGEWKLSEYRLFGNNIAIYTKPIDETTDDWELKKLYRQLPENYMLFLHFKKNLNINTGKNKL